MTRNALATLLLLGLGLPLTGSGCDQTVINDIPFITYDLSSSGSDGGPTAIPGAPRIGMLLDRMGRPAVNTALTDPFDQVPGLTTDQVKDQYNAATTGNWGAYASTTYIAKNLAIFDGFDGNCTNQLLEGTAGSATRYSTLANVLADDRLYVNATFGVCTKFLGVEQNSAGDCGGRHPTMVVMDVLYNLLIANNLSAGYSNGVGLDFDGGVANNAPFPFLIAPK